MKFSHERNVRSLAKKTFGSTRVGSAIRLPRYIHIFHVNYVIIIPLVFEIDN